MRKAFGIVNPSKQRSYKLLTANDLISTYEVVMEQYGWTYWELMSTPIPVFVEITEAMIRRFKKQEKGIKNENKGKGWKGKSKR